MKDCTEYAVLLDLFIDGELPGEEMDRVRRHLEDCPGCRAYVDDALALRAGFAELENIEVPEGFAEGVMERIRRETPAGRKPGRGRRWAGTLTALAACCALVILLRTGPLGMNGGVAEQSAFMNEGMDAAASEAADEAKDTVAPASVKGMDGEEPIPAEEGVETAVTAGTAADDAPAAPAGAPAAGKRSLEADQPETAREREPSVLEADMGEAITPMAPAENIQGQAADQNAEAALILTAEEAGDLLDGFVPALEDGSERRYMLTQAEYAELLEDLGRDTEKTNRLMAYDGGGTQEEKTVLVVVTGPF